MQTVSNRIHIPELGETIRLIEDWDFYLFREFRNFDFAAMIGLMSTDWNLDKEAPKDDHPTVKQHEYNPKTRLYDTVPAKVWKTFLPAGTVLKVDRIYIRKGNKDYSSVTFVIVSTQRSLKKIRGAKRRFWVKLEDANNIYGEWNV